VAEALANGVAGIGPEWLPRLEAASNALPRDGAVALAAGCALAEQRLWGKARALLEQAAADTALRSEARRKAWVGLADLARQEGDSERAARAFEAAARLR
jgi:HemY protein